MQTPRPKPLNKVEFNQPHRPHGWREVRDPQSGKLLMLQNLQQPSLVRFRDSARGIDCVIDLSMYAVGSEVKE